jgi:dTDP-4-amino-4,6-dideoxygalactose transaminase
LIPLVRIVIEEDVKKAVEKVLDSGIFVLGEETKRFEEEFSRYIGVRYGVATSSGTTSLFLILKALNIGDGDEVLVPGYTFIASISPILHFGAKPVFVDIDPETYTLDIDDLRRKVGEKTKAVIPVHLFGHSVDMDPLLEVARKHGLYVIEDAAEAHGGEYKGKRLGSIGDVSFFSFYPSKNMSVYGDGGMVVTNDPDLAEKVRLLRHHGQVGRDEYRYLGYNMKMSEIHAAIGRVELKKLDKRNKVRRRLAGVYREELGETVDNPVEREWAYHVYHLYVIKARSRDKLYNYLLERDIGCAIHYRKPAYRHRILGVNTNLKLKGSEYAAEKSLSLPMSPYLEEEEISYIAGEIKKFYSA